MSRSASSRPSPLTRARGRRRLFLVLALAVPLLVLALWIAVNTIPWLGPIVADGLRAVIGKEAVTKLEDIAYAVQDRFYQYTRKGEKPKAYWAVPEPVESEIEQVAEPPVDAGDGGPTAVAEVRPVFRPSDVGPVHESWSAPGDGQWVPVEVPDLPGLKPHMYKTLLHPDKNRSWAEVFVVALDIPRIDLHLVAGSREPRATVAEALGVERPGVIPEYHHDQVLAAFNGGFKTEHGQYGMRIGEITFVAPRSGVCSVAAFHDGSVRVATWERVAEQQPEMKFWRQTPNCMYEDGELHPKLQAGSEKKWGATLDGETVIRRSAIGIDASGETLFVGISNHTTAVAIATALHHAGAEAVAQLDVNFSYPKFVLYEKGSKAERQAIALASGFEFSEDEFIRKTARRDFFYVTPKTAPPPASEVMPPRATDAAAE